MDELLLHATFSQATPGSVSLSGDSVHVWAVPLDGDHEQFGHLLSALEREHLGRFRFAEHQRRYQISHGALRLVLAGYLGAEAAGLGFRTGPRGKPYLDHDGLCFNLSHSGKLALIGVANKELGVDVEKVRHLESLTPIAQRHFSAAEFAKLEELSGDERELAFYRCWTRKEAYIKALGEGLSLPLDSFEVSLGEKPEFLVCHDGREDPADWSMLDVSPGPGFAGAVAMRAVDPVVQCFRMDMQ